MISAFPKIHQLGYRYVRDIFDQEVEITEKVDGSQLVWGKVNGELFIRSKGKQIIIDACDKLFLEGVLYIIKIQDKLPDNTIFYCEYLQRPHHNVLLYDRIPKNHMILFGASDHCKNFKKDWRKYTELLDIESVPIIFKGKIERIDEFKDILETDSILGGVKIEGVVIKNYDAPYIIGGQVIDIKAAKYVSEKFKEVHQKGWDKKHTTQGGWEAYKECFRTEARWNKAIQHLKEMGQLEDDVKDIGKIIKEIQRDVCEEEADSIKCWLWNHYKKDLLRKAIGGFPEFYKEKLLNTCFNGDEKDEI